MCTCGSTRACRARPRNDSLLCAGPGRTHPPSEGPATRSAVEHSLYGVYEHRVRYNNSAAQRAGHTQHRLVSAEVKRRTGEAGAEPEPGKIYTMREEREREERESKTQSVDAGVPAHRNIMIESSHHSVINRSLCIDDRSQFCFVYVCVLVLQLTEEEDR